jgi:uncharacterized lipoprotein YddW (UPF0748 family)
MQTQGRHFERTGLLIPIGKHPLIPTTDRDLEVADYLALKDQWNTFRQESINQLLQDVYHRVKQEAPDVLVTITVSDSQETLAEKHFLDWRAWLDGGYIDLIIPRAYVKRDEPLAPTLTDWQPVINNSGRVMLGLTVFASEGDKEVKTPAQILAEVELAHTRGSKGVILFSLEGLSEPHLEALATGPFLSVDANSDQKRKN